MGLRSAILVAGSLAATAAAAGEVTISKATASSTYPPEAGAFYSASMAKDRKLGTSWVEGSPGAGLGQSLTLELAGPAEVSEVHLWAGMWYSTEFWNRANRPREIELKASDGTKALCQLTDEMKVQVCKFDKPVRTDKVTLTLKGSYSGTTWMDTGISEVRVFDTGPPTYHQPVGATASSELPDDGDGPYTADRAIDGMVDSMWCEGNKEGDGTGEWLQIDLGGGKRVDELEIVNGIGGSMSVWKKGNRAGKVTLQFSDGSTKTVELKDTHRPQTIPIGKQTSSIKLTVDSVVKGSEYNDLCISEMRAR